MPCKYCGRSVRKLPLSATAIHLLRLASADAYASVVGSASTAKGTGLAEASSHAAALCTACCCCIWWCSFFRNLLCLCLSALLLPLGTALCWLLFASLLAAAWYSDTAGVLLRGVGAIIWRAVGVAGKLRAARPQAGCFRFAIADSREA